MQLESLLAKVRQAYKWKFRKWLRHDNLLLNLSVLSSDGFKYGVFNLAKKVYF